MLTKQQRDWLNHLSDTNKVKIISYNPKVKEVFNQQKLKLQKILGGNAIILHKGASAWGISGKGDVDIYIPIEVEKFDAYFELLKEKLGEPGSHYHSERARWNRNITDIEVEIFLVNKDAEFYKESERFWSYIEIHPEVLDEYRIIKEKAEGLSTREYYTKKVIFINQVMSKIKEAKQ